NKPLINVNHIHGHIFSIFIYKNNLNYPKFPYICLSISGGHTKLLIIKNFLTIKEKGISLDENIGNLYNKISRLLNFKYLKGPKMIEKYSKIGKYKYKIPIPKVKKYNFSFSGIYTYLKKLIKIKKKKNIKHICRSFQETIFIIFKQKINKLIKKSKIKNIVITGGVSNNKFLKKKFIREYKNYNIHFNLKNKINKDNAAMIALVGQIKYYYKLFDNYKNNKKNNKKINYL
ncbi:MAG: tRNA (adenosine(37)-N6)-threonylcarbamoyltransferase complex transferase subunit TsaD, partial [Candidatus Shikimatogenerans sp. JK-2022]|nr:tRNA (adenosine(37)-N6)-threonylcarbamoyltransferase complex transferase subunit TsaD [Candidatus Shikimatogenerans bostrichidophilus]